MTNKNISVIKRILEIDKRLIWIIILILLSVPLVHPWGLPIKVDQYVKDYYNAIENLPPGSLVVCRIDIEAGNLGEQNDQAVTTLQHLIDKNIPFIEVCFDRADSAITFEKVFSQVNKKGKIYGVDWVNVGYMEGKESALAAFAKDFTYPGKDQYGNVLNDLPLLKKYKSMNDVKLIIGSGDSTIRQWAVPYNVKMNSFVLGIFFGDAVNYYNAGITVGILSGLPGAAQYQFLRGTPGLAVAAMDALSASQIFLIGLLIITNAAYIYDQNNRRRKQ